MKTERKRSEEYFHAKPENLNCAQAVLKGFQNEFTVFDSEIEAYRAWGGGRAEDGICGALFSAARLLGEDRKEKLEQAFAEELGSVYCLELKRNKKECLACVRLADKLIEENMHKKEE